MSDKKSPTPRVYESDTLGILNAHLGNQAELEKEQPTRRPARHRQPPTTESVVKRLIERLKTL
jgi:hypothetical protein